MQTFDWIVVGNGLAGAALSYELARQGLSVLLLDQSLHPDSATRYSYGSIAYWAGTTPIACQLCREGMAKHRQLSAELEADTQLRDLDLLLTYPPDMDGDLLERQYAGLEMPPQRISAAEAHALEPLLNPASIAGAFTTRHGHVSPPALIRAYNQGFYRWGGTFIIAPVTGLVRIRDRITGITTATQAYASAQVAVTAGAFSRALLDQAQIQIPLYFTHDELIETPPLDLTLRTMVMPALNRRIKLELAASQPSQNSRWDQPGQEIVPTILDSGAVQFQDRHLCLGQISRTLTNLDAPVDAVTSEQQIRQAIACQLPALASVPGTWRRCHVSFSRDGLPLVGAVPGLTGVQVFTGFSSPFVLLPPVAERFARAMVGDADELLAAMKPGRFLQP